MIYGIETNFYGGGGSKLNETDKKATRCFHRRQTLLRDLPLFWFTDGIGWKSARGNLRETFEVMDAITVLMIWRMG